MMQHRNPYLHSSQLSSQNVDFTLCKIEFMRHYSSGIKAAVGHFASLLCYAKIPDMLTFIFGHSCAEMCLVLFNVMAELWKCSTWFMYTCMLLIFLTKTIHYWIFTCNSERFLWFFTIPRLYLIHFTYLTLKFTLL